MASRISLRNLEFAFEIGSGLLTEVRRLQSLLAERDKAIQDMKEEKDDLDKSVESLRGVLKSQEQSTGWCFYHPDGLFSPCSHQISTKRRTGISRLRCRNFGSNLQIPSQQSSALRANINVLLVNSIKPARLPINTRTRLNG